MAGPRYKIVSGMDVLNREQGSVESQNEDFYLNHSKRGRLIDMARNAARNSPTFNALLKQLDLNVVGNNGGKVIVNFDDEELAKKLKKEFAKWTRSADFFDGMSLNSLLKVLLKTYIIGGDCVLLYDDGLLADSGKIVVYEPDELGNTQDDVIKQKYGEDATQSQGRVYDGFGRFIGCVVSRSERGKETFAPENCYFLSQNPDADYFDSKWLMPRNVFRFSQGRGISPFASALANTIDLEDLVGFELQAAKKNSQTIAQVLQEAREEAIVPTSFDDDVDFSQMTDEQIEQAVQDEKTMPEQTMTLDKITASGTIYQVLPEGFKMELLDTKHPNSEMPNFIKFLCSRSSSTFGLSEQYATLIADVNTYKAQQLISKPAFQEYQHFLEQICDWIIDKFVKWADKKNLFDANKLPEDWHSFIDWSWADIDELDENSHQTAVQMKLTNLTGSYRDELGPDWKEKLSQIKSEIEWFKQNGLSHPSFNMISGGERSESETAEKLYS